MVDLESTARDLLRLDAEATPGPWDESLNNVVSMVYAIDWFDRRTVKIDISTTDAALIAAARNTAPDLARAYLAVCAVIEDSPCTCVCAHLFTEHDDSCVRCLACRVELAMLHATAPAPYATAREAFGVGR